jgi:hypothetical protein
VSHDPLEYAKSLGYCEEELRSVPEGMVCHGCGNPIAHLAWEQGWRKAREHDYDEREGRG